MIIAQGGYTEELRLLCFVLLYRGDTSVVLASDGVHEAGGEENHHTEDDQDGDNAPDYMRDLLGALMKKKTHAVEYSVWRH